MQHPKRYIRLLLIISGFLSIFLGILGIFLPVLPTTPFMLLAAGCFVRSSDRCYTWLISNKWLGKYIHNYRQGKGLPQKSKVFILIFLWSTILFSCYRTLAHLWITPILILIASAVTWHILRIPTHKEKT